MDSSLSDIQSGACLQGLVEKFENTLSPVLDLTPKDLEQVRFARCCAAKLLP